MDNLGFGYRLNLSYNGIVGKRRSRPMTCIWNVRGPIPSGRTNRCAILNYDNERVLYEHVDR